MRLDAAKALYVLGDLRSDALPMLAAQFLADGIESPTLIRLAGEPPIRTVNDNYRLFRRVLREFDSPLPTELEAAVTLKRHAARETVEGRLSPSEGAARIVQVYRRVEHLMPDDDVGEAFGIAELYRIESCLDDVYAQDERVQRELQRSIVEQCKKLAAGA